MKKTDTHTCGECLTGAGQMINVTCNYGNLKNVQEFVKDNIWSANFPTTRQSSTTHGSYGAYSRYQLKQHHYAGGGSGYVEVLEILDAPGERHNIVINMRYEEKTSFFEWETLEKATLTFEKYCQGCFHYKEFEKQDGFKRKINCYLLIPWFYAVGDEVLVGDYAFPTGLQDDPVFRFGEKFIYTDCEHNMSIKTCLGARVIEDYEEDYRGHGKLKIYRLVFFNDGSVWNEYKDPENMPQVITENDVWIDEAMQKFRNFLTGNTKEFEINLTNGQKFIGRWNLDKTKVLSLIHI